MYLPKKLLYSYSSLEPFIDEETMFIHYNKHYLTYIKNLNEAIAKERVKKMSIEQLIKTILTTQQPYGIMQVVITIIVCFGLC
jgi:superoxide dismutase